MVKHLLKHFFLWIVLLLIFFIISFSFVPSLKQFQKSFNGDSEKFKYPGFSKKSLASHEFQKYTETLFEKNIRLRKKIISIHNQLYYSLFKRTFAVDSSVIIGKNKQFFVLSYILDYCKSTKDPSALIRWADQIAQLDRYISSQGKTFLYIITPSKAEQMPEVIPNRFHCKQTGIKDAVYQMDELLTERKVTHINGPDLMTKASLTYHMAMFPAGGVHWNWLGAAVEARAIIHALRFKTHFNLPNMQFTYIMTKPQVIDTDNDMLVLTQLWEFLFQEKVPQVRFHNSLYNGKPIKLSVIGGSFNWSLNKIFLKNKIFSEIDYYFYFNKHQRVFKPYQELDWTKNIDIAEILQADVIILEENSSLLVSDHGRRFYEKMMRSGNNITA
jgi:alginate O-acetyltransferase complex protein AlgJ